MSQVIIFWNFPKGMLNDTTNSYVLLTMSGYYIICWVILSYTWTDRWWNQACHALLIPLYCQDNEMSSYNLRCLWFKVTVLETKDQTSHIWYVCIVIILVNSYNQKTKHVITLVHLDYKVTDPIILH